MKSAAADKPEKKIPPPAAAAGDDPNINLPSLIQRNQSLSNDLAVANRTIKNQSLMIEDLTRLSSRLELEGEALRAQLTHDRGIAAALRGEIASLKAAQPALTTPTISAKR